MASKKPAKKQTARKARRDDVAVTGPEQGTAFVMEMVERLLGKETADKVLPPGAIWVASPPGPSKSEPTLAPEIPRMLGSLDSAVDRLEAALKALRQKLQPIMVNQPADKPPFVSSATTEIGCKIEISAFRTHDAADMIESLTNTCLGL